MSELAERLIDYTRLRAARVPETEARRVASRALERTQRASSLRRRGRNALSAALLAALVMGAVVVLQLRHPSQVAQPQPAGAIPNDTITLSSYLGFQTFRLADRTLSAPEAAWKVADRTWLDISNPTDCSTAVLRVIDPLTQSELRSPVQFPGCFDRIGRQILVLADGTVLLYHYQVVPSPARQPGQDPGPLRSVASLGAVRFDWQAGRIIQTYSSLTLNDDIVLARNGMSLYVAQSRVVGALDCVDPPCGSLVRDDVSALDLRTGTTLTLFSAEARIAPGLDAGGRLAVLGDGHKLILNEPDRLYVFDLLNRGQPEIVSLIGGNTTGASGSRLPLPLASAEAKETGGPSVAADPFGHWVAALGTDPRGRLMAQPMGVWLVNTDGTPRVIGRFHRSDEFRAIAASTDGRVIYLLEEGGRGRYLLLLDSRSGKDLGEILLCTSTGCNGFDGIAAVSPAGQ